MSEQCTEHMPRASAISNALSICTDVTDGRNGLTKSLSHQPEITSSSVTRTPAYSDLSPAQFEARAILATLPRDPKAKTHQRAALRELAMTHCPGCSTKMPRLQAHSTSLRLFCGQDCPGRHQVDDVVVSRLLAGAPVTSTRAERIEAVKVLSSQGRSAAWIADYLRTTARSVVRYRHEIQTRKAA